MNGDGLYGKVAAVGIGRFQYKRGQSPYGERALLIRAIVQACEDAGVDPADVDGFVTYGDDRHNESPRFMPELGTKELRLSTQIWGGGGTGLTAAFEVAAAMIAVNHAEKVGGSAPWCRATPAVWGRRLWPTWSTTTTAGWASTRQRSSWPCARAV